MIAPKTQIEDCNWNRETAALYGHTEHFAQFRTISKETFRRDHATLPHFDTVIVDEAHTCLGMSPSTSWKNKQPKPKTSKLYDALETFLAAIEPERLYLCTATPIRSPMTVFAAARLLGCRLDFNKFRREYYFQLPMPGRDVYSPKNTPEAKDKLAILVRSLGYTGRLEDFFDVPEQTFITKHIELTAEQKKWIKELPLEYPDPIVLLGKKHQVENGVLLGDEYTPLNVCKNGKIEKILELASEFPKMVIFAKYRAQIDQIQIALTEEGYATWTLTGDTKDRGGVIKQANDAIDGVFIAQAQVSVGWELPTYPVMVFASRTYSYVDYAQGIGRIHRANALKKNLYINLVVQGGVDEAVDKCLLNKQDFDERVYLNV